MLELPSHWIFSHLCWVKGLFSILTSTIAGTDTASRDIQGKKASRRSQNFPTSEEGARQAGRQQSHSRHNLGFPLPIPQTT